MTTGSISPTSPQWVTQLVNYSLAAEQKPLNNLQTQRDSLTVRNAVYTDITSKITAVQDSITALVGSTYGVNNAFQAKSISIANANPDVNVANVKTSGTKAVAGVYDLNVTKLAQAHQVASARQAQSSVALGYSGTFIIGGAASRSVLGNTGANNPVSAFGTGGTIRENQKELGTGDYSVEFRQSGSTWQFRVVDSDGNAVSIDDSTDADTNMTANWQDFSNVKNSTFDTGRGMTISFADADPTEQQLFGSANIANADYTAQGASIEVLTTDTLDDIRTKISDATFADGNEVTATVVDRRLVLTAGTTGEDHAIKLFDSAYSGSDGSGVLKSLGLEVNTSGDLTDAVNDQLKVAQNAAFTINNISISRNSNTGLTDVVQGLSFDLLKEGQSTITVSKDESGLTDTVTTLLKNINDVMSYIKAKTEASKGDDDEKGNPTYTPAALGSDWSVRSLRGEIASDLLGKYTGAIGDAPAYLYQIGITLNSDGQFVLSDTTALTDALSNDFAGTQSLFSDIFDKLNTRLDRYVDGSGSILKTNKTNVESQMENIDTQISSYEKRLASRKVALTTQYTAIQAQLIEMTYQYQSFQAFSASSINQQY
jgi:flagellar hook-associated protein 2